MTFKKYILNNQETTLTPFISRELQFQEMLKYPTILVGVFSPSMFISIF